MPQSSSQACPAQQAESQGFLVRDLHRYTLLRPCTARTQPLHVLLHFLLSTTKSALFCVTDRGRHDSRAYEHHAQRVVPAREAQVPGHKRSLLVHQRRSRTPTSIRSLQRKNQQHDGPASSNARGSRVLWVLHREPARLPECSELYVPLIVVAIDPERINDLSRVALGKAMAEAGRPLVYGGGSRGIMGAVSGAVLEAGGDVTGVVPYAMAAAGGEVDQTQGNRLPPIQLKEKGREKVRAAIIVRRMYVVIISRIISG